MKDLLYKCLFCFLCIFLMRCLLDDFEDFSFFEEHSQKRCTNSIQHELHRTDLVKWKRNAIRQSAGRVWTCRSLVSNHTLGILIVWQDSVQDSLASTRVKPWMKINILNNYRKVNIKQSVCFCIVTWTFAQHYVLVFRDVICCSNISQDLKQTQMLTTWEKFYFFLVFFINTLWFSMKTTQGRWAHTHISFPSPHIHYIKRHTQVWEKQSSPLHLFCTGKHFFSPLTEMALSESQLGLHVTINTFCFCMFMNQALL